MAAGFEIRDVHGDDGFGVAVYIDGKPVINFAGYPSEWMTPRDAMNAYPAVAWEPVDPESQEVGAVLYRGELSRGRLAPREIAGGAPTAREAIEELALRERATPARASEYDDETGRAAWYAELRHEAYGRLCESEFSGRPYAMLENWD